MDEETEAGEGGPQPRPSTQDGTAHSQHLRKAGAGCPPDLLTSLGGLGMASVSGSTKPPVVLSGSRDPRPAVGLQETPTDRKRQKGQDGSGWASPQHHQQGAVPLHNWATSSYGFHSEGPSAPSTAWGFREGPYKPRVWWLGWPASGPISRLRTPPRETAGQPGGGRCCPPSLLWVLSGHLCRRSAAEGGVEMLDSWHPLETGWPLSSVLGHWESCQGPTALARP